MRGFLKMIILSIITNKKKIIEKQLGRESAYSKTIIRTMARIGPQ